MLMALGNTIGGLKAHNLPRAFGLGAARLVISFVVAVGVSYALGLSGVAQGVLVLQGAMPAAVFSYLFAARYERDADDIAGIVLVSTLLGASTLPLAGVVRALARGSLKAVSLCGFEDRGDAHAAGRADGDQPASAAAFAAAASRASPRIRVPVAANGWPTATLPPLTLSLLRSIEPIARSRPSRSRQNLLRLPRFQRRERLRGERFVDLVEVEVLEREVRFGEHRRHGVRGRHQQALPSRRSRRPLRARASGTRRSAIRARCAQSSDASSTADAPSVSGVLLPAVSVPPGPRSNTGLSFASCSRLVSVRMLLSRLTPWNSTTRSS